MATHVLTAEQLRELAKSCTNEEKIAVARAFGWSESDDNSGQIVFYTELKVAGVNADGSQLFRELTAEELEG